MLVLDGAVYKYTANALEEAAGGGDATEAKQDTIIADLATVDGNVDDILVDTGTTIPADIAALNDVSAVEVNAECDTAISDAALATAVNLAIVDGIVDDIKEVTVKLDDTLEDDGGGTYRFTEDSLEQAGGDDWTVEATVDA